MKLFPVKALVVLLVAGSLCILGAAFIGRPELGAIAFAVELVLAMIFFHGARSGKRLLEQSLGEVSGLSAGADVREHLSSISRREEEAKKFISAMSDGGQVEAFSFLSNNAGLGASLVQMKEKLSTLREEEQRRNWTQEGLAKFSGLLKYGSTLDELAEQVIKNLVTYTKASQGAIFVSDGTKEDPYLMLKACYAYNRKKFLEKKVMPGQGMVGECMLSKDMIYLKEVPANYVQITSGLGEALPRNIIILPLVFNGDIFGVVEMASFIYFEKHHIEFLKEVSENIAAEIAARSSALNTELLLAESNRLTGQLTAQEEELKQNMEELTATQEEMERKQAELNSLFSAINNTVASVEFDLTGKVLTANTIFCKLAGYNDNDVANLTYSKLLSSAELDKTQHHMMWTNLRSGHFFAGEFKFVGKNGDEMWLTGTFNPICNSAMEPYKVIMIAQFTGAEKAKLLELTNLLGSIKHAVPYLEIDSKMKCKSANDKFLQLFGLKRLDLKDLDFRSLLDSGEVAATDKLTDFSLEKHIEGEFPYRVANKVCRMHTYICPVKDQFNKVTKAVAILVPQGTEVEYKLVANR